MLDTWRIHGHCHLLPRIGLVIGIVGIAGPLAAGDAKNQAIPDFAPTATTGWVLDRAMGVDDLLPPPSGGPGPVTFDRAHPYVPNGRGVQSTYRVADLSNPILQPWTIPSMKKANDEVLAGKVPFRARERCWPVGVPGFDAYSPIEAFFFYQTPEKVVMIAQAGPEIRHVYLNVTHAKDVKPSWYGESVGHYENGDTLVIDTIGISAKSFVDNYRTPHTDQLHVVERLKLAADGQSVDVTVLSRIRARSRCRTLRFSAGAASKAPRSRLISATRTTAISSTRGWCRCPKPPNRIFDTHGRAVGCEVRKASLIVS